MTYDITGLSENDLTIETEFVNKTKETFINVKGKKEFETLNHLEQNIHILNIYQYQFLHEY
jgi:hypothetical protein